MPQPSFPDSARKKRVPLRCRVRKNRENPGFPKERRINWRARRGPFWAGPGRAGFLREMQIKSQVPFRKTEIFSKPRALGAPKRDGWAGPGRGRGGDPGSKKFFLGSKKNFLHIGHIFAKKCFLPEKMIFREKIFFPSLWGARLACPGPGFLCIPLYSAF